MFTPHFTVRNAGLTEEGRLYGFIPRFRPGVWRDKLMLAVDWATTPPKTATAMLSQAYGNTVLGPRVTGLSSSQRRELETREEATRSHLWMQQRAAQQGQMQASQAVWANQQRDYGLAQQQLGMQNNYANLGSAGFSNVSQGLLDQMQAYGRPVGKDAFYAIGDTSTVISQPPRSQAEQTRLAKVVEWLNGQSPTKKEK